LESKYDSTCSKNLENGKDTCDMEHGVVDHSILNLLGEAACSWI
jgi:hypothetical protein